MLTVKDSQDGFAGPTGTIWTVKPDCSFEVARFRGSEVSPPHLRGQLTPDQQSQLAAALSTTAIGTLPDQIGEPAPVNSHKISIEHDGKTAVLNLGMGEAANRGDLVPQASAQDPTRRVIEISKTVKSLTGSD